MPLSESELGKYCREKGLYPEQVKEWRQDCLYGFMSSAERKRAEIKQAKAQGRQARTQTTEKAAAPQRSNFIGGGNLAGFEKKAQCLLRGRLRGRLTPLNERQKLVELIQEALSAGCRLEAACKETQISLRTYRRWVNADGHVRSDRRLDANRPEPKNKLSTSERQRILEIGCLPGGIEPNAEIPSELAIYRLRQLR